MEGSKGGVEQPQAQPANNPAESSPKDVELPPSRWDSPKSPTPPRVASPEPNCAICLGALENKSFTNSCMHQFCFVCLLEWSKVKAECPLCKNTFKSIIHNVRSMEDYDQYEVLRPAPPPDLPTPNWMSWSLAEFAYGTMQAIPSGRRPPPRSRRDRNVAGTSAFRRDIYDQDLWARMQPDVSGRYRECSPQFYRLNPGMLNRLVPFLQRELNVLIPNSPEMPMYVEAILQKLRNHRINGREFQMYIRQLVGVRHAAHFCHELHAFASSPFDMIGYDRATEYNPNNNNNHPLPDLVEVIEDSNSSSDSDTEDTDSDVQCVSRTSPIFGVITTPDGETTSIEMRSRLRPPAVMPDLFPPSPQPGPSGLGHRILSPPRRSSNGEQSVYIVDSSDSDECTIVDVVKPRHERTPVLITLSSPETSPRTPHHVDDHDSSQNVSVTATEPFDSDIDLNLNEYPIEGYENVSDFSSVPSCSKGKVKRRTRFNSSGSSSSSEYDYPERKPPTPEPAPKKKHRTSHWKKDMAAWSLSTSPPEPRERPRLRSVATRVSTPPRRHRDKAVPGHSKTKYDYSRETAYDSDDSCGPSTSYSSASTSRHHRDRLILQRTSSVSGEDVWTVNSSHTRAQPSFSWQSDSDEEYRSDTPERSTRRKRSKSENSDSGSSSGHSRHKRRDFTSKSKKKHKKKDRSKSKKRRKQSERKDRSKRCKFESSD